ncbi:glutamate-cysteine ligase family protein [Longimicrobium sp.]|uniref:glutamate-cysteine ligase family protein n=1 Tax=Longimicrobium sp. TaxID=2029185 RepID=UPI002E30E875|nr:glutamate-cysteine ligase family protein [Longimicrobium sp.]HEX6040877.1 glutamate-cysteine ligase family protein [Longimicrobium sp.]
MPPLARADLLEDLRTHAFALGRAPGAPRIGAEVELIPVAADTGAQVPIVSADALSTLPLLRRFGVRHGWTEQPSPYGVPQWTLPDGGLISYEPGGQIELSAAAFPTATALLRALRATVLPLTAFMRDAGIELLSVGVEPRGGLEDVDLQLPGARYVRLTNFLRDIGTGGERMMRQTAAMQVSVDLGAEPLLAWRVLNAMAPYVTAIFASSPVYRGEPTGHRSYRARIWRELDGGRTGCFPCADPVAEYLDFALAAPALLLGDGAHWRPFAEWNAEGCAGPDEWRAHLTTLFPEIRPKGFAEVRSADAVAPEWYAAPLVLLAGILYHAPTLRAAADRLGAPDPALLHPAGRDALADPAIAAVAGDLARLAMEGAAALPGFFSADDLDEAAAFFARYTFRARSPADDALDALPSPEPAVCHAAD